LHEVVEEIARLVRERAAAGKDYGVILIPEGLFERLTDAKGLTHELASLWASKKHALEHRSLPHRRADVARKLTRHRELFLRLPVRFQELLCLNRDAHGNLKLSQLPTEELLAELVRSRVERPEYSFKTVTHFYGYEGRCGAPSAFDQWLGYNLGLVAGSLVADGKTGYLAAFGDLAHGGKPSAVPIAALLDVEQRAGEANLVIRKRLIEGSDRAFREFLHERSSWRHDDALSPHPRDLKNIIIPVSVALNEAK
jgi:pyrophosphate--fructose-6-phosphate 1-phosphotransferase